jgi:hypothetical protein
MASLLSLCGDRYDPLSLFNRFVLLDWCDRINTALYKRLSNRSEHSRYRGEASIDNWWFVSGWLCTLLVQYRAGTW